MLLRESFFARWPRWSHLPTTFVTQTSQFFFNVLLLISTGKALWDCIINLKCSINRIYSRVKVHRLTGSRLEPSFVTSSDMQSIKTKHVCVCKVSAKKLQQQMVRLLPRARRRTGCVTASIMDGSIKTGEDELISASSNFLSSCGAVGPSRKLRARPSILITVQHHKRVPIVWKWFIATAAGWARLNCFLHHHISFNPAKTALFCAPPWAGQHCDARLKDVVDDADSSYFPWTPPWCFAAVFFVQPDTVQTVWYCSPLQQQKLRNGCTHAANDPILIYCHMQIRNIHDTQVPALVYQRRTSERICLFTPRHSSKYGYLPTLCSLE